MATWTAPTAYYNITDFMDVACTPSGIGRTLTMKIDQGQRKTHTFPGTSVASMNRICVDFSTKTKW